MMLCVRIEEKTIYQPITAQAFACLRICQMLSTTYRNIELFRFDEKTQIVYIFAGEEIQIIVDPDGNWRFLNAAEF